MGGGGLGTGGRIITGLLLLAHLLGGDLLGLGQLAAAHAVALFLWAERRRCQNGLLQVQVQAQGREGIRTAPANFFCAASRALSRWLPRAILISEKWTRSSAGCRSSGRGGRFALSRCVWCVVWLAWSARSVEWDFDANTEGGMEGCLSITCCRLAAAGAVQAAIQGSGRPQACVLGASSSGALGT